MCNEKTSDKLVLSFLPVHVMTVMPQFVAEVSWIALFVYKVKK